MVVALRISPPVKGKVPKLNMLELVSVASNTYRVSKLRKRIIPQGFCYVCSRIDPSGIFRKPNSYLYRKGFFQTCEHFPKAPYTTFVQEEVAIQDDDGGESLTEFATNRTETISVTIRRGSRSTKFPSPLKREGTFDSRVSKFDKDQRSSRESLLRSKVSDHVADKFSLPSIVREGETTDKNSLPSVAREDENADKFSLQMVVPEAHGLGVRSLTKSTKKSDTTRTTSGAHTGLSRKSHQQSETLSSVGKEHITIPTNTVDQVTFIPTGTDRTSAISGLSTFSKGTTPSKSTNDLDSKFESEKVTTERSATSKHSVTTGMVSASKYSKSSAVALSDSYHNPFVTEVQMNKEEHWETPRRPKAGHRRMLPERYPAHSEEKNVSSHRPESGHFRYHHRMTDDSVPDPGFEIPPTPSEDFLELEKLKVDQEDNIYDSGSSKGILSSSISDDASLPFSQKRGGKSTRSSHMPTTPSERRSFCRCTTDLREISFSRNICKTCGKACHLGSSTHRERESSQGLSRADNESHVSSSNLSTSTRQRMLQRDQARMNIRSKPFTDEDYMDIDSIIHEDDGRYWSSDEEFAVQQSPVSWYRYKHAQPYPLVNPEIHKLVYIEALQAARIKGKKKAEDLEIDELSFLRRPNVFSYIPLLPYTDQRDTKYIGIRPDDSAKPKKGQFMKHIFGDVRPDDFYPSNKGKKESRIIYEDSTNASTTEMSSSDPTEDIHAQTISQGPERSSVSLKLRKQGISFDNDV